MRKKRYFNGLQGAVIAVVSGKAKIQAKKRAMI
jgi:hypothetical protein